MKKSREHSNTHFADQHSKNFLAGGKILWTKSQEMVWAELETSMLNQPTVGAKKIYLRPMLAVAAALLVLLGLSFFFRYYTLSIETPAGTHQLATLPDGSTVKLNAESSISYHPYWWRFKREVVFEGEGFFEVQKGKTFSVHSSMGSTTVLGTSFNILAREQVYRVTCLTGSVQVRSNTLQQVILQPNAKAEINPDGSIEVQQNVEPFQEISWKENIFLFTAVPLRDVFREIERQFGVSISLQANSQVLYTGNFSRQHSIEEVLSYVCPPFGLNFQKNNKGEYLIVSIQE